MPDRETKPPDTHDRAGVACVLAGRGLSIYLCNFIEGKPAGGWLFTADQRYKNPEIIYAILPLKKAAGSKRSRGLSKKPHFFWHRIPPKNAVPAGIFFTKKEE